MHKEFKYVGFWRRFGAHIIDLLIFVILLTPFILFFMWDEIIASVQKTLETGIQEKIQMPLSVNLIVHFLTIVIILFLWKYRSATPGKMIFSAYIVDEIKLRDGIIASPSWWQLLIRFFGYIPSFFVFCLGFFWVIWDKKKQSWHDKISKTVIINKKP